MKPATHLIRAASVFAALAIFLGACQSVPYTGRSQFNILSPSEENDMGVQAYQEVRKDPKTKILTTGADYDMVKRVATNIAAAADKDAAARGAKLNFQWEVMLVDSPTVNAWCMPGGKMCVYTGILPVTQSEAGLAVVLGHEVSHAVARHGGERMSQGTIANAASSALEVGLGNSSPATKGAVMQAFGAVANYGAILPYSRAHESEADHIGLILMSEAGYDPREGPKLWQRMIQLSGFTSTHPAPETRIKDMEGWMPEILEKYYKGAPANPKNPNPNDKTKKPAVPSGVGE
jgi:predicted Zn-dependent protease